REPQQVVRAAQRAGRRVLRRRALHPGAQDLRQRQPHQQAGPRHGASGPRAGQRQPGRCQRQAATVRRHPAGGRGRARYRHHAARPAGQAGARHRHRRPAAAPGQRHGRQGPGGFRAGRHRPGRRRRAGQGTGAPHGPDGRAERRRHGRAGAGGRHLGHAAERPRPDGLDEPPPRQRGRQGRRLSPPSDGATPQAPPSFIISPYSHATRHRLPGGRRGWRVHRLPS
ncbi:conserved hypothetical protein, partial [Ricinus communis]